MDENIAIALKADLTELTEELERLKKSGLLPKSLEPFLPSRWPSYRDLVITND